MTEHAPLAPVQHAPPRGRLWVIVVLIVAIPIAAFVVLGGLALQFSGWRAFHMASASMLPGLGATDHFFVDQHAYANGRLPGRGDLVAFFASGPNGARVEYVKRVVGLPGERVAMRNGVPIIDGIPLVQVRVGELDNGPARRKGARLRETLPDGTAYEVLKLAQGGLWNDGGPVTVPAASYFVLGDNRDESLDSRVSNSGWWFVPAEDLIGQVKYIYWSGFDRLDRIGIALK